MKVACSKVLIAFVIGALPLLSAGQNLTGIWRGYFITERGENYRLEFQIKETKSHAVSGVSYSYLDTRFYGKSTMMGMYAVGNQTFIIQELRTIEVKSTTGGGTCLMNYKLTYDKSGREEFLEGTYLGKSEDRLNPKNNGTWGDCGSGTVFLRRVPTSDFYVEPFLRNLPKTNTHPPAKATPKPTPPKTPANAPEKKPVPPAIKKPVEKTTKLPPVEIEPKKNEIEVQKPVEAPRVVVPKVTRARDNELVQTYTVNSKEILIRLYDNGEIDNDTISLYLDGKLLLANKRLSATPVTYTLTMDASSPEHTLIMVAENMGRIPPNTSLMIVQDGNKRYQVSITSTEQKNAMVRFRYEEPKE
jgi:hypothetical protein